MSGKWTPGPWSRNIKPASKYSIVFAGRNTHIASVCSAGLTDTEVESNCNLIAAAPELYRVAELLAAWDQSDDDPELISQACSLAREALAKVAEVKPS